MLSIRSICPLILTATALQMMAGVCLADFESTAQTSTVGGTQEGATVAETVSYDLNDYLLFGPADVENTDAQFEPENGIAIENRAMRALAEPGCLRVGANYSKNTDFVLPVSQARASATATVIDDLIVTSPGLAGTPGTLVLEFDAIGDASMVIVGQGITAQSRWELRVGTGGEGGGLVDAIWLEQSGSSNARTAIFLVEGTYPYLSGPPTPSFGGAYTAEIPIVFGEPVEVSVSFKTQVQFSSQWAPSRGELVSAFLNRVGYIALEARDSSGNAVPRETLTVIGATGHDYRTTCAAACLGDTDGSGAVDLADLNAILSQFGQPAALGDPADFDGSGFIDLPDLNAVLSEFGNSCI